MRILFIGDVVGRTGRGAVARALPELRKTHAVDLVVANAENSAAGIGATPSTLQELRRHGVDLFTLGNHTWRKKELLDAMDGLACAARPANFPEGVPGRGAVTATLADGRKAAVLNLLGRVYMDPADCPFAAADRLLPELRAVTPVILVDFHAEATSEKAALGWHLDGRCSAVIGTHTHVQTADECVLLPVANTTAEWIARWIGHEVLAGFAAAGRPAPSVLRVAVDECLGQHAVWERVGD